MAVTDMWHLKDGKTRSKRYGRGLQWQVRVGDHPAKSFRTKRAAQDYERELYSRPASKMSCETKTSDLLQHWYEGKNGLSQGGHDAVKAGYLRARNRWGDLPPSKIYDHEVQSWIAGMTVEKVVDGTVTAKPASRDTKSKALSALRGAMKIAVKMKMIDENPCSEISLGTAEKRDPVFLTVPQVRVLIEAADKRYRPMIWFMTTTGVRIGECCNFRVGDVFKRVSDEGVVSWRARVRKAKNKKGRDVPVPETVVTMLDLKRPSSDLLFTSPQGKKIGVNNWRHRVFNVAAESLSMEINPHDLRHTAASLMIRSGATVKDVQNALGHASAKMTLDLYAGWWDDSLDTVSARMNALMSE